MDWESELRDSVTCRVVTDAEIVRGYDRDQALARDVPEAAAVVFPTTTEQVQDVMRFAWERDIPVVPRGEGTGLSGGALAVTGAIVLVLSRMNQILEISPEDLYAIVEPGVITARLKEAVSQHGVHYPPDPASVEISSVGGNVATNAGGLCCVKYGVTRDYVLGLEVVLADGRSMFVGRRTRKGVAGYDLVGLLVGSEGTLAVVTRIVVRLVPTPATPATLVAVFDTPEQAGEVVAAATADGLVPSLCELLDRTTIGAIEDYKRMGLDRSAGALLLAQSDAGGDARQDMERLAEGCRRVGARYVAVSDDPAETEALLAARRLAYEALTRRATGTLIDDVAVPPSRMTELLIEIGEVATRTGLEIGTLGHIGDGNFHPIILYDRNRESEFRRATEAFEQILSKALELGGTITGEHGVGTLKRPYLVDEVGPVSLEIQRGIKDALDPKGILNPGKVL